MSISTCLKFLLQPIAIVSLTIVLVSSFPQSVLADEENLIQFIPYNSDLPPEGPPESDSTGSRGDCEVPMLPLTRLAGRENDLDLSLTVSDRPTFWFYVPYPPQEATSGTFSLQDELGEVEYWRTAFQLSDTPGIVSITLPNTIDPLNVGQAYYWFFDIDCPRSTASNRPTTPASVNGKVERISTSDPNVEPGFASQIDSEQNAIAQIELYATNGIWYDALDRLAQLRLENSSDANIERLWKNLLTQVGLEHIAEEPVVGSVQIVTEDESP